MSWSDDDDWMIDFLKEFEVQQRRACLNKAETMMKELKPQFEHFLQVCYKSEHLKSIQTQQIASFGYQLALFIIVNQKLLQMGEVGFVALTDLLQSTSCRSPQ